MSSDEAWFGSWFCDCTDVERTPQEIPERCPVHDRGLIYGNTGTGRAQLTHSGVSGYGLRDKNGERLSAAAVVVQGTTKDATE